MKKRLFTALLAVMLLLSCSTMALAASPAATLDADKLNELGLFSGAGYNADGSPNYDLDRAPTRYESVVMLIRLLGKEAEAKSQSWDTPLTDVVAWAQPYVGYAYTHGLTAGYTATTFNGDATVTTAQYLTFVLRALGYDSSSDFRWDKAWEFTDALGLTNGEYASYNNNKFLRANMVQISYAALEMPLKDGSGSLAEKLIAEGVFDEDAYDDTQDMQLPPVLTEDLSEWDELPISFRIDGREYASYESYRHNGHSFTVEVLLNGDTYTNYTVDHATKNADGTFTVKLNGKNDDGFVSVHWHYHDADPSFQPEPGEDLLARTDFIYEPDTVVKGLSLQWHGRTQEPGSGFGTSSLSRLVVDTYYDGQPIYDYSVTTAAGSPFTASVQADGTLLIERDGSGIGSVTIYYNGESATFNIRF